MRIVAAVGRYFSAEEEHFGGPNAFLSSDSFWRRRFHGDPNAVGKKLRINGFSYSIVGIMPASFLFPDRDADVWVSVPPDAPYAQSRQCTWYAVIGRLKPGMPVAQARPNLTPVQGQLAQPFPNPDPCLPLSLQPLKPTRS